MPSLRAKSFAGDQVCAFRGWAGASETLEALLPYRHSNRSELI